MGISIQLDETVQKMLAYAGEDESELIGTEEICKYSILMIQ